MAEEILRLSEEPSLREPVVIMAFSGWNDAAEAATGAVRYLIRKWKAVKFAAVDPEEFYDFTEVRPEVRLRQGLQRQIEWPANEFYYSVGVAEQRDYVLMVGVEPQLRWRTFCSMLVGLLRKLHASQVVLLGGLIADVPHTRPVRVSGSANDAALMQRLESLKVYGSRYEGPTGILGVFTDALRREGIACVSLWATVPHYISTANPRGAQALLQRLDSIVGLRTSLGDIEQEARDFDDQVARAVERDPDVAAYVRQLEESDSASDESEEHAELPAGDVLLKELEDFLRQSRGPDAT